MATVDEYRQAIVAAALAEVAAGSHYVWGAAGATPGGNEGILGRPGNVSLAPARLDAANPAVFAAQCAVDSLHVCGGRWDAAHGGIPGGRPAAPIDVDLIGYLATLALAPPALWQPYFLHFSPRMVEGRTVQRQLVWGEDCRGKRHFDCVGFVNSCVETALGRARPIQYDIPQWAQDAVSGTTAVAPDAPAPATGVLADVVIQAPGGNFKHIGILFADAAAGGALRVVQAEQTSTGVLVRDYAPAGWTHRRRLTAAILHA